MNTLVRLASLSNTREELIKLFDEIETLRQKESKLLGQAIEALKVLANWPRRSATADGTMSVDPAVGLANVRRFARAVLAKAEAIK